MYHRRILDLEIIVPVILPVKETKELQILRAARDKIAQGWCQDGEREVISDEQVNYCALGAIKYSSITSRLKDKVMKILAMRIDGNSNRIIKYGPVYVITDWNDSGGRTQADVLALFDAAIAEEEKKDAA